MTSRIAQVIAFCIGLAGFYVAWGASPHRNIMFLCSGFFIGLAITDWILQTRFERRRRK